MTRYQLIRRVAALIGPAFVAAIAYVDPGNFAANFSAGARYEYLLLWVLLVSNIMAAIVQYHSAKVGLITGKSLPEIVAQRLPRRSRIMYWMQAELVAVACDIAEIVGGAVALNILFGVPMVLGGLLTGAVSLVLLRLYTTREQKYFERIIMMMLIVIPLGFIIGLIQYPPDMTQMLGGVVPQFAGPDTVLLAAAMMGATIMPHVIYLHSAVARDRHGKVNDREVQSYLQATKIDVGLAMLVAGTINIAMLVLAATVLSGSPEMNTFDQIYAGLAEHAGGLVAVLFAVGLLVSGIASTSVGAQAGAVIMGGLIQKNIPTVWRRALTLIPALVLLALGFEPTSLLIFSQAALSFGIPFALIPLYQMTSDTAIMAGYANTRFMRIVLLAIITIVSLLNIYLLGLLVSGLG